MTYEEHNIFIYHLTRKSVIMNMYVIMDICVTTDTKKFSVEKLDIENREKIK